MAEDEIRKHTKAALAAMHNPDKKFKEKFKDVLLEIVIIVFAVSISIWFHNLSDKYQENTEAREFLTALQGDLRADEANMINSKGFYQKSLLGMTYFAKVGSGTIINMDSLKKYEYVFFSSTDLEVHNSRFEGLKGSGKFGIIENKDLLNQIINFHEATVPHIQMLDNLYEQYIQKNATFIGSHAQLDPPGHITNVRELFKIPEMRFLLTYGKSSITENIIKAHDDGIKQCNSLLNQIGAELKK